jgi:Tfp pilus assembly protein PilX
MQTNHAFSLPRQQAGSTLVMSLIILILLMLLGVAAMTTSDTQYKLTGNLQFEDSAMNNAEAAMVTAEAWLIDSTGGVPNYKNAGFNYATSCTASHTVPQLYALNTSVSPAAPCLASFTSPANDPLTMTWDDNSSVTAANSSQRYIIELMSTNSRLVGSNQSVGGRSSSGCNQVNTYRITARGRSARGAIKFVQSFYSVLSC